MPSQEEDTFGPILHDVVATRQSGNLSKQERKQPSREKNYAPAPMKGLDKDTYTTTVYQQRQAKRAQQSLPSEGQTNSGLSAARNITPLEIKQLRTHNSKGYMKRHPDYDPTISTYLTPSFYRSFTLSERLDYYGRRHKCQHKRRFNKISLVGTHYQVSCDHDRETIGELIGSCGHCGQPKMHSVDRNCDCEIQYCAFCKVTFYTTEDSTEQYCHCKYHDASKDMEKHLNITTSRRRGAWGVETQKAFLLSLAGKHAKEEMLNSKDQYESFLDEAEFPVLATKQGGVASTVRSAGSSVGGLLKTIRDKIVQVIYGSAGSLTERFKQLMYGMSSTLTIFIDQVLEDPLTGVAASTLLYEILIDDFTKYTFVKLIQLFALTKHLGLNDFIYFSFLDSFCNGTCVETLLVQFGFIDMNKRKPIQDYIAARVTGKNIKPPKFTQVRKPSQTESFATVKTEETKESESESEDEEHLERISLNRRCRSYQTEEESNQFASASKIINLISDTVEQDNYEDETVTRKPLPSFQISSERTIISAEDYEKLSKKNKKAWEKKDDVYCKRQMGKEDKEPEERGFFYRVWKWMCKMFGIVTSNKALAFAAVAGFAGNFNKIFTFGRNIFSIFTDGLSFMPQFIRKMFQSSDGGAYIMSESKDKDSQTFKTLAAASTVQLLISQNEGQKQIGEARVLARAEVAKLRKEMADAGVVNTQQSVKWFQMIDSSINALYNDSNKRLEPFCIMLYGAPGLGKSACAPNILSAIYPDKTIQEIHELTYTRSPDSDFWDGYVDQPILYYDDFGQSREEKDLGELIQAVSCHNYILNMASIDKSDATTLGVKGTSLKSQVVLCCSNMAEFNPTTLQQAEAVNRRFHLRIKAVPSSGKKALDFSHLKFMITHHGINPTNSQRQYTLAEIQDIICSSFLDHAERVAQIEQSYQESTFKPNTETINRLKAARGDLVLGKKESYSSSLAYAIKILSERLEGVLPLAIPALMLYTIVDAYEKGLDASMKAHPWVWIGTLAAGAMIVKSLYSEHYRTATKESGTTHTAKPAVAATREGSTPLIDKISDSVARLCLPSGESVVAVCLGQRDILTVEHFFHEGKGSTEFIEDGTVIVLKTNLHAGTLAFKFDSSRLEVLSSRHHGFKDLAIYRLRNEEMQPAPNIIGHFSDTCETPENSRLVSIGFSSQKNRTVLTTSKVTGNRVRATYTVDVKGKTETVSVISAFMHDMPSGEGDCGTPVFSMHGDPKIVGMHIAGGVSESGALATLTPKKLIQIGIEQLDLRIERIQSVPALVDAPPTMAVAQSGLQGNLKLIGSTTAIPTPTKTTIQRSPLFDQISDHISEPAALHDFDRRLENPGQDILLAQLNKYAYQPSRINDDLLTNIVSSISEEINSIKTVSLKRVLTLDEAINGIPHYPYVSPINMTTSAGYPYALKHELRGEKRKLFTPVPPYVITNQQLQHLVDFRWNNLMEGKRVTGIHWLANLKDERRPIEKVRVGKTRLFVAAPLCYVLNDRRLFLGFVAHLYQSRHQLFPAIGINKGSLEWDTMICRLKEVSPNGNAGDIGRFDGTVMGQLHAKFAHVANKWYNDNQKYQRARRIMMDEILTAEIQYKDNVMQLLGGDTSGVDLTAIFNSFAMEVYLRYAYAQLVPERWNDMHYYRKWCRSVIYGDDHILSVAPHIQPFMDEGKMSDFFANLGIEYTREDKSGGGNEFKPIEECGFLKNTTGKMLSVHVPIMNEEANLETINWVRKCEDPEKACEDNCNSVLRNCFFSGRDYFSNIRNRILKLRPSYNLITYGTLYHQFYNNGYIHDPENYLGFTHNQPTLRETELNIVTQHISAEKSHKLVKEPKMIEAIQQKTRLNNTPREPIRAPVAAQLPIVYMLGPWMDDDSPLARQLNVDTWCEGAERTKDNAFRPILYLAKWYPEYGTPPTNFQRTVVGGVMKATEVGLSTQSLGMEPIDLCISIIEKYLKMLKHTDDDFDTADEAKAFVYLLMSILTHDPDWKETFYDETGSYDWDDFYDRALEKDDFNQVCAHMDADLVENLCHDFGRPLSPIECVMNCRLLSEHMIEYADWYAQGQLVVSAVRQSGIKDFVSGVLEPVELVGDLLSVVGLDKPAVGVSITPNKEMHYLSTGSDLEKIDKMTLDPQAQTMCTPVTFGTTKSATALERLFSIYSLLAWFDWKTSDEKGKILYQMKVGPFGEMTTPLHPTENEVTLLSYCTVPFSKWRGGLKMGIKVFTSAFHEGRLSVRFHPAVMTPPEDIPTASSQYVVYMDIRNVGSYFEVVLPYITDTPWKKVWNGVPLSDVSTDNAFRFQDYFIGTVVVAVEVPLKATTSIAPSVRVELTWAGADDYEVNYPLWNNSTLFPSEKDRMVQATKQSGKETEANLDVQDVEEENRHGVHLTEQTTPFTITPMRGTYTHMSKYPQSHLNENSWELKQMLERSNLVLTQEWNGTSATGDLLVDLDVPGDMLQNSLASTPFSRFTYLEWKIMRVTVELKASRYMQGAIRLDFKPTQRPKKKLTGPGSFVESYMLQSAIIQAPESGTIKFEIPWLFYKGYIDLANQECLGQFRIWCQAPLQSATGTSPVATMSIFANIVEPNFKIPRPGAATFSELVKLDELQKLVKTYESIKSTDELKELIRNAVYAPSTPSKLVTGKKQSGASKDTPDLSIYDTGKTKDPNPKSEATKALEAAAENAVMGQKEQVVTKKKANVNTVKTHEKQVTPVAPCRAKTYDPPIPHFAESIKDVRDLMKRYSHFKTIDLGVVPSMKHIDGGITIGEPIDWPGAIGHYAPLFRNFRGPLNFKIKILSSAQFARQHVEAFFSFSDPIPNVNLDSANIFDNFKSYTAPPFTFSSENQVAEFQIPYTSIMYSELIGHEFDTVNEFDGTIFAPSSQLVFRVMNLGPDEEIKMMIWMAIGDEAHMGTMIRLPRLSVRNHGKISDWPDSWVL